MHAYIHTCIHAYTHAYTHLYTNKYAREAYQRVPASGATAGCYAPLRTTSRRFHHLSARFDDTTSADLADYRHYRRVGQQRAATDCYGPLLGGSPTYLRGLPRQFRPISQQRAATDHFSRFPHLSARFAEAFLPNSQIGAGSSLRAVVSPPTCEV